MRNLVASALLLLSCSGEDPPSCPPTGPLLSGTYSSSGDGRWSGGRDSFPHDNKQPKVLRLDREAGRLIISYRRDGQEVVETWRLEPDQRSDDAGSD